MSVVPTTPVQTYKNRRAGLVVFGILQIALGLLAALMSLFMVVGALAGNAAGPEAPPPRVMAPTALLYFAVAVMFVVLGIGSIRARRWARAIILALSWMWLIVGGMSSIGFVAMSPHMFDALPQEQASMKPVIIGCMSVFFGLFFIVLPLVFVLFYRGPNVRATVEAVDAVPRWTDGMPLPLLVFAFWMLSGALSMMFAGAIYTAFPLGPWMLHGVSSLVLMLAIAGVTVFIGLGSLKRMRAAWWTALVLLVVGVVYGAAFMRKIDVASWYKAMSMPMDPRQLEMVQSMVSSPFFFLWMAVMWALYLGLLLYVRRYFFGGPADSSPHRA
jgi:hypothetical protein